MAEELLFERSAILKVFPNDVASSGTGLKINNTDPIGRAYPSRLDDGSPGFRIRFKVDKIVEPTPNPTSIYIYNLGPDSRAFFEQINNTIILEAGYLNSTEIIFRGNISRTRTRKVGPDYITQIEAADGLFETQNSRIDVSFGAGVNIKDMVTTLTSALGVNTGEKDGVPNKTINHGRVFSGPTKNHLTEILGSEGLEWSIQDGGLVILPRGSASGTPALVLSPETGLLGIPEKMDVGIQFKALLNPKIKPFQNVLLQSKFINGVFRSVKVTHNGDTFEGPWQTDVEAS